MAYLSSAKGTAAKKRDCRPTSSPLFIPSPAGFKRSFGVQNRRFLNPPFSGMAHRLLQQHVVISHDRDSHRRQEAYVTKIINPAQHAVLDYATAGTFFALAARYRNVNRAASTLALLNGMSVLMLSLFTDYPGGVIRTLSFRTHGVMDAVQAAMSAAGPALFGFAGK